MEISKQINKLGRKGNTIEEKQQVQQRTQEFRELLDQMGWTPKKFAKEVLDKYGTSNEEEEKKKYESFRKNIYRGKKGTLSIETINTYIRDLRSTKEYKDLGSKIIPTPSDYETEEERMIIQAVIDVCRGK